MERRLAAIMATDVAGYSRLIRADEEGTIAALKAWRIDLVNPRIAEYCGRIFKLRSNIPRTYLMVGLVTSAMRLSKSWEAAI